MTKNMHFLWTIRAISTLKIFEKIWKTSKLYGFWESLKAFDLQTRVWSKEMNSQVNWLLKDPGFL